MTHDMFQPTDLEASFTAKLRERVTKPIRAVQAGNRGIPWTRLYQRMIDPDLSNELGHCGMAIVAIANGPILYSLSAWESPERARFFCEELANGFSGRLATLTYLYFELTLKPPSLTEETNP